MQIKESFSKPFLFCISCVINFVEITRNPLVRKHYWGPSAEGFPVCLQKMLSVALQMKAKMLCKHI